MQHATQHRLHTTPQAQRLQRARRAELAASMTDFVQHHVLPLLKPVDDCWQPCDLLPDPASEAFIEQIAALRARAAQLPDDYLVVLVGDMVTEEALPTYTHAINLFAGVRDETGADPTPWAQWSR